MKLTVEKSARTYKAADTYALFVTEEQNGSVAALLPVDIQKAANSIDLSVFKGKQGDTLFVPLNSTPSLIICGIGKEQDITGESLRISSGNVTSLCRNQKISTIHIIIPVIKKLTEETILRSIAEGLTLSNYSFSKFKTKNDEKPLLTHAYFNSDIKEAASILKEVEIISANTLLCRDLVNDTTYNSDPQGIAKRAEGMGSLKDVSCTIYGKAELKKMKMGLLLAVNQGSKKEPRLIVLTYRGAPAEKKSIALVGKGITFDSGGMNLKPSGSIETMRMDMAGAAAVLFAFKTAVELKMKKNIHAVIPLTENMLSSDAYRPGDVFTAYNGQTVEIGNTDAEGRLILADALSFTEKTLKPEYIIDLATLTGACVVTFGEITAALLSNDEELTEKIRKAGEETGEKIWPLPLYSEYEENLKSDTADICNIPGEKNAGTIHGATFLKNFIQETKWAHLDIAGTAWYSKPRGYRPKNATGYGVRLLVNLLRNWK